MVLSKIFGPIGVTCLIALAWCVFVFVCVFMCVFVCVCVCVCKNVQCLSFFVNG